MSFDHGVIGQSDYAVVDLLYINVNSTKTTNKKKKKKLATPS